MAAHYWRSLLACELFCAVALAVLVSTTLSPPPLVTTGALLVTLLATPCALVGISVVATRCGSRGDLSLAEFLRALMIESVALERVALAMSLEPWRTRHSQHHRGSAPAWAKPVLLIHGLVCNRAVWRPLEGELRAHGFGPIRAVNLEPLLTDLETLAIQVVSEVRRLRQEAGGQRVAIVSHSMGGLVARAALRAGCAEDISQIVTVGSPHHGTSLARLFPVPPLAQMRIDCEWLTALNRAQEGHFPVPLTSIYSANDNFVVPSRSAALAGATLHELRGRGHLSLLGDREVIDRTLAALARCL